MNYITREIKFRAWDGERIRFPREMHFDSPEQNSITMFLFGDMPNLPHKNLILMQFTGIECNGQEWYEGDILECDADWYQITWDEDQAQWEATGIRSTGQSLSLSDVISSETWVQGNVYESPELLTT